ncbi:MAG: hypothetical protein ACXWIU_04485 [Limisphaerales bacterium]
MKLSHVFAVTASATILAGCAQWNERFNGAQSMNFNELPPAVQATVRNEIGNQPIAAITREKKYGEPSYRVEVQEPGLNPTVWVAKDGSIIKESRELVLSNQNQYRYQNHYQIKEAAGAQPHLQNSAPPKQSSGSNY